MAEGGRLSEDLKEVTSPISIKYRLDDIRLPSIVQPGYVLEVRMTGDVLLMSQRTYPALYVTQQREIEAQVVSQANHAFGALVNDSRFVFDSERRTLTYRSMLVSQSNIPNRPVTAIGIQAGSQNPIPRLRFEFRYPKLTGAIPPFNYTAIDVKVVGELTPDAIPPAAPSPEALRIPRSSGERVLGAGLVAGAIVLVVGTLVEDFFTAGAGVVDDPASFAAASAGVLRGLQLLGGATIVLPAVAAPAAMRMSVGMSLPGGTVTQSSL